MVRGRRVVTCWGTSNANLDHRREKGSYCHLYGWAFDTARCSAHERGAAWEPCAQDRGCGAFIHLRAEGSSPYVHLYIDQGSGVCITLSHGTCQRSKVTSQTESEAHLERDSVGLLVPDLRSQAPPWPGFRAPAVLWEEKRNLFKVGQRCLFPLLSLFPYCAGGDKTTTCVALGQNCGANDLPRMGRALLQPGNFPRLHIPFLFALFSELQSWPARYSFFAVKR